MNVKSKWKNILSRLRHLLLLSGRFWSFCRVKSGKNQKQEFSQKHVVRQKIKEAERKKAFVFAKIRYNAENKTRSKEKALVFAKTPNKQKRKKIKKERKTK